MLELLAIVKVAPALFTSCEVSPPFKPRYQLPVCVMVPVLLSTALPSSSRLLISVAPATATVPAPLITPPSRLTLPDSVRILPPSASVPPVCSQIPASVIDWPSVTVAPLIRTSCTANCEPAFSVSEPASKSTAVPASDPVNEFPAPVKCNQPDATCSVPAVCVIVPLIDELAPANLNVPALC